MKKMKGCIRKLRVPAAAVLSAAMIASMAGCGSEAPGTTVDEIVEDLPTEEDTELTEIELIEEKEGNIIDNPFFSNEDTSMWTVEAGSSAIAAVLDMESAPEGYISYGTIDRDPSSSTPYDCFAQDVTDTLLSGVTYDYEFYVMLSDDYQGAPDDQTTVDFAPFLTVNGSTSYLGSYSPEITGLSSQSLTPGIWTRFAGTFTPQWSGTLDRAVIRIIEQGTNYGNGDCVLGDYSMTGLTLVPEDLSAAVQKSIEYDIPDLSSVVASSDGLGEGAVCGTSVTAAELHNGLVAELAARHFNAITPGNELKLDSMLGYNNSAPPEGSIHTEELNGEELEVPALDYSRADEVLDTILSWNEANPDKTIRARGHVLVWHSQAPEWFFHENYDKSEPYVTSDEMNKRLEWYIKSVLEYYTAPDSPYSGLFYGWDVVNEAVSDSTGTYRTDTEDGYDSLSDDTHSSKSSWWRVYGSNEYIINAFRYANKYAPADLELYYNDYNETDSVKQHGILELLRAVKAEEGAPGAGTRIDGFGMQGHYSPYQPSIDEIENAAIAYSGVVDKVMITELDVRTGEGFDGSDEAKEKEYIHQAHYYNDIYNCLKALNSEGRANVTGITVWGVIDTNSWLQSASFIGGGADGRVSQFPLLFDGDYKAKLSYWAFVDDSKLPEDSE